ncbi:unnamed protein product [Wuchereria bancrofti]|uniref:Potassium channel domain-containing protein n=1 Tax=Wuchereria bancrofti TaxID=6293 RepID=A0A3P7FZM4_WUCBA|nr:unnamed protein product [Wuchereria bancrofti]
MWGALFYVGTIFTTIDYGNIVPLQYGNIVSQFLFFKLLKNKFVYISLLFYILGYGNIVPRTPGGKALSIVYAIFGIPLVLAILSQFGKTLTTFVSDVWMRYYCLNYFDYIRIFN